MSIISLIESAAEKVGIQATVSDSEANLKTQLNRLTEDLGPQALIGWDLVTSTEFNEFGFLETPTTPVTMLLMDKADSKEKSERIAKAEEMKALFFEFCQQLRSDLIEHNRTKRPGELITGMSAITMPKYGMSQHAGVVGNFTMASDLYVTCS